MARKKRVVRTRDMKGRFYTPFRFMDLPAEIRNRVYDHAVTHPDTSQQPEKVHTEACGEKCDCDIMTEVEHDLECVNAERGEEKILLEHISPGPQNLFYLQCYDCCGGAGAANDKPPSILRASKQTRTEALGLFYSENIFVVNDDNNFMLKDWLFKRPGWANMKNIRRLFCEYDENDSAPDQQVVINYAVIILLMELGLLKCQLRVTFALFHDDHIGCKLREWIRKLIASRPIVKADVEGQDAAVVEALVASTAIQWRCLWLDDGDTYELGDDNEESTRDCTVCESDEEGNTATAPLFDSMEEEDADGESDSDGGSEDADGEFDN